MAKIDYTALVNKIAELNVKLKDTTDLNTILLQQNRDLKKTGDGSELKKRTENTNALNASSEKLTQTEKEIKKASDALEKQRQRGLAIMAKQEQVQRDLIAASKMEVKSEDDLIKKTNALVKLRRLADKTTKEGRQSIKQMTAEIKKNTNELKKSDAAIGRSTRGVGAYAQSIKRVALQFIGITGLIAIFKKTVSTIVEFQKAQSTLQAISGKTSKELKGLTRQAKELGGITEHTATSVTNLQTELAKLGFSVNEIRLSTKAILNFASATGADLPSAAKTAGVALRVFGLDASRMEEVVSSLAVATTKSALKFEDYDTILSKAGPVAKAYGFSLQDILALTGKLADSGFDASSSATALRNIMLNLADTNGPLAKALGRTVNTSDDLIAGLIELRNKGVNLNETLQLTDKRSVAAFNTFLQGAESVGELREGVTNVNKELQIMIDKKLDNLAGDVTKLSSAWEGFILKGEGGVNAFRYVITFLNDLIIKLANLDLIFTRSVNLTEDQIKRSYDVMLSLTDKKSKEFQDLIKFSNDIVFESVKTQDAAFEKSLQDSGFTATESAKLWDEYLKRREEQNIVEIQASEDAKKAQLELAEKAKNAELDIINDKLKKEQEERDKKLKKIQDINDKILEDEKALIKAKSDAKNAEYEAINELNIERANKAQENRDKTLEAEKKLTKDISAAKNAEYDANAERNIERAENESQEKIRIEKEEAAQKQATRQQLAQATIQILDFQLNSKFEREQAERDQYELAEIEALKSRGLSEEEFNKESEKIRIKYAKKRQKADIKQAWINTALAVGNALATVKPFVPAALIAAGLAATMGSVQVSNIKKQKLAKGKVDIQGEGTETSDSIPADLSKHESVITAKGTKRTKNTLTAINKELSNTEIINALATDLNMSPDVMFGGNTVTPIIMNDERLLNVMRQSEKWQKKLYELELERPVQIPTSKGIAIRYKNSTYYKN